MANKKKASFGGKLVRLLLELIVAVAILFFAAKMLPKDFSITSIGSGISQSLLITTPAPLTTSEPEVDAQITAEPSPVAFAAPVVTGAPVEEDEVGFATEMPTEFATDVPAGEDEPFTDDGLFEEPVDIPEEPEATEEPDLVSTARTSSITISAAGDCTLGGDTTNGGYTRFEKVFDSNDEDYFLAGVRDIFESDDITIVNLEGALTTSTSRKDKTFSFKGAPRFGKILTSGSVEVVSLDNNHSQDYYSQGVADTKKTLEYLGIGYAGLGESYTTTVEGVTVGFLSYRVWDMEANAMAADIQKLKQECDLVIVSIHWGDEKVGTANATQIKLGHAAVDAGADLVLGHHPHVVGSIELYNGKYIVYSLGNFCFGGNSNPADKDTFIFQQTFNFENGELKDTDITIIPCSVSSVDNTNDYQPTPLSYDEGGYNVIKKIAKLSRQFESTPDWEAILLKLDGAPETIGEQDMQDDQIEG